MAPVRFLTVDTPIADINIHLKDAPSPEKRAALEAFISQFNAHHKKHTLRREDDFRRLQTTADWQQTPAPGGSMGNMFTTLGKLMGQNNLRIQMIGVTGDSYRHIVRKSLEDAGVELLPHHDQFPPGHPSPETAVSYVILDDEGKKSVLKYLGNVNAVVTPAVISNDMVEQNDIVMLQGNNWFALEPGVPDKLRTLAWHNKKENWLALPTGEEVKENAAKGIRFLIPSTNVVLGNIGELHRIYRDFDKKEPLIPENELTDDDKQRVLKRLQADFKKSFGDKSHMMQRRGRPQVGFITTSKGGAYIVTADDIKLVPPKEIVTRIANDVGAGDTANAGFAFGYLHDLPYEQCAEIGNALAAAKLTCNEARLPDPAKVVREKFPELQHLVTDVRGNGNYR